jgi:formimidoylglutamate deiminase
VPRRNRNVHYKHKVSAAEEEPWIGSTLLPASYAHSGFEGAAPDPRQSRFVTDLDGYALLLEASRRAVARLDDAVVGVAPHSLRACTPAELGSVVALAGDAPVHIHRIHATHVTVRQLERIAGTGATVGLRPMTEGNLGDGIFPGAQFMTLSGSHGIGSNSNVLINYVKEPRLLGYTQRLALGVRNAMSTHDGRSTGRSLFESALEVGSLALGTETKKAMAVEETRSISVILRWRRLHSSNQNRSRAHKPTAIRPVGVDQDGSTVNRHRRIRHDFQIAHLKYPI